MVFTETQLLRYARNMVLPGIGREGQEKLLAAKVLIAGAGGLGSPVALYLAAAGVGSITIADGDKIEISNLQRQILYDTYYLGRPKAEIAAERLADLNPDVKTAPVTRDITPENAADLVAGADIVADCTDNFASRHLLNRVCREAGVTLVSAAAAGFEGHVYTFKRGAPCYSCVFPEPPGGLVTSCSQAGILGAVTGVLGSLQAAEIVKELLGMPGGLAGRMLIYDALAATIRNVKTAFDENCQTCGGKP